MIICLGENIRMLRTEKGLTQEQLGYELGVSGQAVSRWENGATYPDISMLPLIADYFSVSLDDLMGRGKELSGEERDAFFKKMYALMDAGSYDEVIQAYNQMLHKHSNDPYLLHGKAWVLYSQFKKSGEMEIAREIISLCNKINCANKPDMQCGASALLVRVYTKIGETEKAIKLVNALPSFEVGRELLLAECLPENEQAEYYHYLIERLDGKIAIYRKQMANANQS